MRNDAEPKQSGFALPLVDREWAASRCAALTGTALIAVDTGPVLHLGQAGAEGLLLRAGPLIMPPAVRDELARLAPPAAWMEAIECRPLTAASLGQAQSLIAEDGLHLGESEAIALALEHPVSWFLTDDLAAMDRATELGLMADGSLGVLHWATAAGHVSREEAEAYLTALAGTRLWLSAQVLARARAALALLG